MDFIQDQMNPFGSKMAKMLLSLDWDGAETMAKGNNRRPQAPKRRNYVAKHAREFNKAQVHRDRTKYDRYEDYLKDQLDDYVNNEWEDFDDD